MRGTNWRFVSRASRVTCGSSGRRTCGPTGCRNGKCHAHLIPLFGTGVNEMNLLLQDQRGGAIASRQPIQGIYYRAAKFAVLAKLNPVIVQRLLAEFEKA